MSVPQNPFKGPPIKVQVEGPENVTAGAMFHYLVKVQDIDQKSSINPTGVDPNLRIAFKITSMKTYQFQIAPYPDSDGNLLCFIRGLAQDAPGVYLDGFRGYNAFGGLTWDLPADVLHPVTVALG
jgi:hypothetical protein